jgi:MYXO-CTERM domain-containing protein
VLGDEVSKRAILAAGVLSAAAFWSGQAGATSFTATYDVPDTGGTYGGGVNHFDGPGKSNTDIITINLTGPGRVSSPATMGAVDLNISFGPFQLAGFSSFTWLWQSNNLLTNVSGTFNTTGQNTISLPFTATTPTGAPYSSYRLYLISTTSGLAGGGYVFVFGASPCSDCAPPAPPPPPPTAAPVVSSAPPPTPPAPPPAPAAPPPVASSAPTSPPVETPPAPPAPPPVVTSTAPPPPPAETPPAAPPSPPAVSPPAPTEPPPSVVPTVEVTLPPPPTQPPSSVSSAPVVPVPPAAILFVSGLAGLGALARRRRRNASETSAQA